MTRHSVVVHFHDFAERFWTDGSDDLDPLYELEDDLETVLSEGNAGELDGHEVAMDGSDGYLFFYGPDANALYAAVLPVLQSSPVTQGGSVTLRHGDADDETAQVEEFDIKPSQ